MLLSSIKSLFFQLCFQKLYNAASDLENASSWLSQYRVVNDSLKEAFCIGDAKKNAQRIDTDFYLSAFHPVQSLNLENIFYDFARLSQILASDCIPIEVKGHSNMLALKSPCIPVVISRVIIAKEQARNCH